MRWIETGLSPAGPAEGGVESANLFSTLPCGGLAQQTEDLISRTVDGETLRIISPVIDDQKIVGLICEARKRGVIVRVLTTLVDRHGIRTKGWDASQDIEAHDESIRQLAKSGALLRSPVTTPHGKLVHNSTKRAIFGSANLAKNSLRGHALEAAIALSTTPILSVLEATFDVIWKMCPFSMRHSKEAISVDERAPNSRDDALPIPEFLPADGLELLLSVPGCTVASERLAALVAQAKQEIVLVAMSLYHTDEIPEFGEAILSALKRGVRIRAVIRQEHFKREEQKGEYPDPATLELIRHGMELTGIRGLHAKGFLIDDAWCGIQSANFNPYSLDARRPECNLEMFLIGRCREIPLCGYARWIKELANKATHRFGF